MFVDSANQWKGGSMILERLRLEKKEITQTYVDATVRETLQKVDAHLLEDTDWDFSEKAREFYIFHLPRLNRELASLAHGMSNETNDGCNGQNGFEPYRRVCYEIDAVFNNADSHLEVAIQRLGEKPCNTSDDSKAAGAEARHDREGIPRGGWSRGRAQAPRQIVMAGSCRT